VSGAARVRTTGSAGSRGERRAFAERRLPGVAPDRLPSLGLTRRELAVLELVAAGLTNRQIGAALSLSPLTVKTHLERISDKIGVSSRAALVALTWQRWIADSGGIEAPDP
jgi:ATP/maltotriose-dependent transcriptional regulator MalT